MTSGYTLHVCLPTSNCEQKNLFPSQVAYTDIAITYTELINSAIKATNIDHWVEIEGGGGYHQKQGILHISQWEALPSTLI